MSSLEDKEASDKHESEVQPSASTIEEAIGNSFQGEVQGRRLNETPKEFFKRIAENDSLQNRRLSASVGGLATASTADLYRNGRHQKKSTKMRFVVCALGLVSLAVGQMSRAVLNLTITQMVEQTNSSKVGEISGDDDSCPWPEDEQLSVTSTSPLNPRCSLCDQMDCDHEAAFTDGNVTSFPLVNGEITEKTSDVSSKPKYERFKWTIQNQQVLLGSFYYSYFIFMVSGGRLAEMYGAKYVLFSGIAGSALINLATPLMAHYSFTLLVISRIVMGAIQSGVIPAVYELVNKWLTMGEASIFVPLIKMNLRLGMLLGSLVPGIVEGWPNVFYITSGLSLLWSVLWILLATSDPAENKWVSAEELTQINRKKHFSVEGKKRQPSIALVRQGDKMTDSAQEPWQEQEGTPWVKILTSPSVIGLIFVKLTFNYSLDFLVVLLPSYLGYVHHLSKETISSITSSMFTSQVVLIVFVGWLAKLMVQKRPYGISKTTTRKLFQGLASYGLAFGLFLFTFNDCNVIFVAILLQVISILSMFTAGGETMLPYDLSSKYPATIMAVANTVANMSAITTTTLAGLILRDQGGSFWRWNLLIYLIAGANLLGGLAFSLLVKAEPIDLRVKRKESSDKMVEVQLGKDPEEQKVH